MFFKKKVPIPDYCDATMKTVFGKDQEATWETFRASCNDDDLTSADAKQYYNHLRTAFIQLMLIAIAKNCRWDVSSEAHVFVMIWLKEAGYSEIQAMGSQYSQAFASSRNDGVLAMAEHFADNVSGSQLRQETIERLNVEFYGMLKVFYEDFKSVKLTSTKR